MEDLIQAGESLLDEGNFSKGKLKIWQIQSRRTLATEYDSEIADEFDRTLNPSGVIRGGMGDSALYNELYRPKIVRAVDFLQSLHGSTVPKVPATEPTQPAAPPTNITVRNGTVIIGNNNTATNVTIKSVLEALAKEIDAKSEPGENKNAALSALKSITTNKTVATVVGQTLGAFLAHSVK